jgi:23S rRNA maturation-related 3'-5' exoribonuclease YhaM
MGAVADRTKEHLGTSDTAIIAARRILLKLARDLQEGTEPYAPQHPEVFAVRAIDVVDHEGDFDKLMAEHSALSKTKF